MKQFAEKLRAAVALNKSTSALFAPLAPRSLGADSILLHELTTDDIAMVAGGPEGEVGNGINPPV